MCIFKVLEANRVNLWHTSFLGLGLDQFRPAIKQRVDYIIVSNYNGIQRSSHQMDISAMDNFEK